MACNCSNNGSNNSQGFVNQNNGNAQMFANNQGLSNGQGFIGTQGFTEEAFEVANFGGNQTIPGQTNNFTNYGTMNGSNYEVANQNYYDNYYTKYNNYYVTDYNYVTDYYSDYNVYYYDEQTIYNGTKYLGSQNVVAQNNGCGGNQGGNQGGNLSLPNPNPMPMPTPSNNGCGCKKHSKKKCGCGCCR